MPGKTLFRYFFILACTAFGLMANAQPFGFEWIHTYQPYYKFKIAETGVYRIDSLSLTNRGVSLINVDPKRFQIFKNGVEQRVYIKGESDGIFNNGDFIELFAEPNDGMLDQELYRTPAEQPNTFKSQFTDTAYYFLTLLPDTSVFTGKRYTSFNDNDYASYSPEPIFEVTQVTAPQEDFYYGAFIPASEKYYISDYGDAEGMSSYLIGAGQQRSFRFSTPARNNSSNGLLEIKIIGASDFFLTDPSAPNHHVKIYSSPNAINPSLLVDTVFRAYGAHLFFRTLVPATIGDSSYITVQEVNDLGVGSDFVTVSYIKFTYFKNNQAENKPEKIVLKNSINAAKTLIQLSNYAKNSPLLLDITNYKRAEGIKAGNLFKALLPYSSNQRELMVLDETETKSFPEFQMVNFPVIDPNANNEYLIISHWNLQTAAQQYQTYRSQKYKTLLVYSEQLYDYYFYGNPHPLAIRRFCKHLYTQQMNKPLFLFLLGRGYQNNLLKSQPAVFPYNLVPAIGVPSSDNLFTNGFDAVNGAPSIATGRVPANNNTEAINYLDKVIYYETHPDSINAWRKNYLHISGGADAGMQNAFRGKLFAMGQIVKSKPVGGNIFAYGKNSTKPSDPDQKINLIAHQNKGINLLTFYGHASLTVLDMDFGSIGDLIENNHCALYYINGCNAGNANDMDPLGSGLVYGKDFICAKNKGAIGWLAHTNLTFTNNLEDQMDQIYGRLGNVSGYGQPIGMILKNALAQTSAFNEQFSRSHALQLLYQGDPAVVLYSPSLADYKIEDKDLFISPSNATVQNDSLSIGIILNNIGKATGDTIRIHCIRTLPDKKTIDYPSVQVIAPYYQDTFFFTIHSLNNKDIGLNEFRIKINEDKKAKEISYSNNEAVLTYFLPGSGIQPLFPYNYAIVNKDTVELMVQNNNLAATQVPYVFEIDTGLSFSVSSPYYKKSGSILGSDLVSWKYIFPTPDSMVYYWRAKMDIPENEGGIWVTQSFTYIRSSPLGWRQSKYAQVKNVLETRFIQFNDSTQKIEFSDNEMALAIDNKRWDHRKMGVITPYMLNAGVGSCISQGTVVLIFEPFQVDFPYELPNYPFNCAYVQANKFDQSIRYYTFNTNSKLGETELKRLIDSVPNGYYVAMFSRYSSNIPNWDAATKTLFQQIGSYKVEHVQSPNTAWAVIGKKGDFIGTAAEDTVNNNALENPPNLPPLPGEPQDLNIMNIHKIIKLKWYEGDFTSALVGPANSYSELKLQLKDEDLDPTGRWWLDVYGVRNTGSDSLLLKNQTQSFISLSSISAKLFPFLKLKIHFVDSENRTPQQFGFWQVNYEPSTDITFQLNSQYSFYKDVIDQGDSVQFTLPIRNVGYSDFDSSLLSVNIYDANRTVQYQLQEKINSIETGRTYLYKGKIPTKLLSGKQVFYINVNSDKAVPEYTYNNNFYSKPFEVKSDKSSPFLDVTFDGQRILNGDIVSPNTVIKISSTDQNKFLLQSDTGTFILFIKKPKEFDFERIYFSDSRVQFIPALNQQNQAVLQYTPGNLADGIYSLKVQANDASGNRAGGSDYEVDFNVINKSTITHFYPYPNPFTTQMHFVFTLTGRRVPDQLMVRILTISGKIVREIRKDEFGPIHIGNNISEFAWDGTDQYGDRLANGVYLYQVYTKIEGNDIENRATKAKEESSFFVGKTGKIYLMR